MAGEVRRSYVDQLLARPWSVRSRTGSHRTASWQAFCAGVAACGVAAGGRVACRGACRPHDAGAARWRLPEPQRRRRGGRGSGCGGSLGRCARGGGDEEEGLCFRVEPQAGRGLGVIASRALRAGDVAISERPLLTYRGGDAEWVVELQRQYVALPSQGQQAIMALQDSFAVSGEKSVPGIVRTNCFMRGMGSSDGVLCPTASRFNHSCVPNCEQSWDEDLGEMQVYASTDISVGEELTIFYIDIRAAAAERAVRFRDFGFKCGCPACSAGSAASDGRRERLQELVLRTGAVAREEPARALEMVSEAMALYDVEGIHVNSFRKGACQFAAVLSLRLGNEAQARQWSSKAVAYSELCHGATHAETRRLRALIDGGTG